MLPAQNESQKLLQDTRQSSVLQRVTNLKDLKLLCLGSTALFSELALEFEEGQFFKNPWHIRIMYDLLDGQLMQLPTTKDELGNAKLGKIVFNTEGKFNRRFVFEIPRNHAKSTAISVNWPIREMHVDQNERIVIGSNAASQSESFLREIKGHLERGSALMTIFGSIVPKQPEKWTDSEIIVIRNTKKKDPTVSATSTGGTVLSKRATRVILDDILNPENTRTPEQREKVKFWVNNVVRPIVEPKIGKLALVGTVWFKGDYLDERMADESFDVRLRLTGIIVDSKTGEGYDPRIPQDVLNNVVDIRDIFSDEVIEAYGINARESVLWPERLDLNELLAERTSIGSIAFNRQYMNIVLSEDTEIIKSEWLEAAKKRGINETFLDSYVVSTSPYGPMVRSTGIDLAISEKTTADWTVVFTIGLTKDGRYKILNIKRGHYSPATTRSTMVEQFNLYEPELMIVENNAYQESLRKDMADYTDLPIQGYTTGGEKFDEYVGINSIGVLFENNKIDIPYGFPEESEERNLIDQFVYECESFGMTGHTGDMLMAFWFAIQGIRQLDQGQTNVETLESSDFYAGRKRDTIESDSDESNE